MRVEERSRLYRPKLVVLNLLNTIVYSKLAEILESISCESGVRVVVLTGGGDQAFAARATIAAMQGYDARWARWVAW